MSGAGAPASGKLSSILRSVSKNSQSRLAVITPTLGLQRDYLLRCGALVQEALRKDGGWHIVVTPQGRLDEVQEWLPKSIVIAEQGKGMYAAINVGAKYAITRCGAKYLTYINDDDGLFVDGFNALREVILKNAENMVVYGRVRFVDVNERCLGEASICRHTSDLLSLFSMGIPGLTQQGVIFASDCFEELGGFDEKMSLCGDAEFLVRLLMRRYRFVFVDVLAAFYRCRPGQLSDDVGEMRKEGEIVRRIASSAGTHLYRRLWAWWRFRLSNAPTIVRRLRQSGVQSTRRMFSTKVIIQ